tara:strand:- start:2283 stop:2567 length:285 start_codon:yes stop_codon:yes gene_type:complete
MKKIRLFVSNKVHKGCIFYEDRFFIEDGQEENYSVPECMRNLLTGENILVTEDEWDIDEWKEYGFLDCAKGQAKIQPYSIHLDLSYNFISLEGV